MWSTGWPLFLAAKLPGGFPLVRSGWREVHCRGSCGLGSASLVAYASALASVFQSVPNMGFGQPLSKEESKQIGRERKTTKERESEKVGCQIESPHLFFLPMSYCQDHGDFLFSLILREKGRGGFETRLLCPQRYSWYRWPAKHTLLCHER